MFEFKRLFENPEEDFEDNENRGMFIGLLVALLMFAVVVIAGAVVYIVFKIGDTKEVDNSGVYKIVYNGQTYYTTVEEPVNTLTLYDTLSELDKRTSVIIPSDLEMLRAMQSINTDVIGIIKIDNTVLDHAFCMDDGTDKYIRKDLYGHYNSYGTPYLDYRCTWIKSGRNHIIYGHNIPEGNTDVFAPLSGYETSDYYKQHPVITTITDTGTKRWLVVAYFLINTADEDVFQYTNVDYFNSKAGFEEYMSEVEKRNWLTFKNTPYEFGDTFLTLSSCSLEDWGSGTNRMVVIARLLDNDEMIDDYVAGAGHNFYPLLPGMKDED